MSAAPPFPFPMGPQVPMGKIKRRPFATPPTEPNCTIYIRNLHEKVRLETLIRSLKTIFSTYGTILDLKVQRHIRMRGQAFIVFDNKESATRAVFETCGYPLFSKPMDVQFAREKSFLTATRDGTLEEVKRKREERLALREEELKRLKNTAGESAQSKTVLQPVVIPDEYLPPNNVLFVQDVPADCSQEKLTSLFKQYEGFVGIRFIPSKKDIAFADYDTDAHSTVAKENLNNYKVTDSGHIKVSFAKK